jgi:hypothetical protein
MPRVDISRLPDPSRIWIFGISPALDDPKSARMLRAVDGFLDEWAAHGQPIVSARDLLHGSFLVIAVDQRSETSGCSIDRMFGLLRSLEHELAVSILDPNRVFFLSDEGGVNAISRAQFRERARPQTVVFDTVAERLSEIRTGSWKRPAAESWHRALLAEIG